MSKTAVSVRIEEDKIDELDQLASLHKRDRSFLINEAISMYLDLNSWQIQRIKESLKQAKDKDFASDSELSRAVRKWRS